MADHGTVANIFDGYQSPTPDLGGFYNGESSWQLFDVSEVNRDSSPTNNLESILDISQSNNFNGTTTNNPNQIIYKMRGWRTVQLNFEFWISIGAPSTSNPSGQPITDITIVGISRPPF